MLFPCHTQTRTTAAMNKVRISHDHPISRGPFFVHFVVWGTMTLIHPGRPTTATLSTICVLNKLMSSPGASTNTTTRSPSLFVVFDNPALKLKWMPPRRLKLCTTEAAIVEAPTHGGEAPLAPWRGPEARHWETTGVRKNDAHTSSGQRTQHAVLRGLSGAVHGWGHLGQDQPRHLRQALAPQRDDISRACGANPHMRCMPRVCAKGIHIHIHAPSRV